MTKDLVEEALRWANGHPNRRSSELMRELADALAAVPDAATEPIDWQRIAVEQTRLERGRAEQAEAERDAALAAIERVRAINTGSNRALYGNNFEAGMAKALWLVKTVLDGAPEPETAPENYEPKCNGACVVHGSPVTNWPVQYGRRNRETGALHWLKGDPFDSWWHENQDRYEHVKRYTSPPLPVEGESKP